MRKAIGTLSALLLVLNASTALGQAAYQLSRDRTLVLIQKDVGDERWGMFYDARAGTIYGNVFVRGRAEAAFVSCDEISSAAEGTTFLCYGAGACTSPPCREYSELGQVTLPDSFLRPAFSDGVELGRILESASRTDEMLDGAPRDRLDHPASLGTSSGARTSSIQLSHEGRFVLLQKDVGAERWTVLYDPVGGSIYGNVFSESNADHPVFVDCERISVGSDEVSFDCFAAEPCTNETCPPYDPLGEVTLPASFLRRPRVESGWADLTGRVYDFAWVDDEGDPQARSIEFSSTERFIRRPAEGKPFGVKISALEVHGNDITVPPPTVVRIADIDSEPVVPFDFAMFFGSTTILSNRGFIEEICESLLFSVAQGGEIRGRLAIPGPCSRSPIEVYEFMKESCAADDDGCGIEVVGLVSTR